MAAQDDEEDNKNKMAVSVVVPRPRDPRCAPDALKVVALQVTSGDTVASIKVTLHDMVGIPPCRQRLVFPCSALPDDDDTTLGDHGVADSATIQLVETNMQVFVRDWVGRIDTEYGVESCDTVESFRLRLVEQKDIILRPRRQRIICGRDQLEDGHTLAEYGVRHCSTVSLLPRPARMRHRVLQLDIEVTDTVRRIKELVEEAEGVPVACQSVSYCANDLDDGNALALHGRALEWVHIECQRHEKGDTTNTTNKIKKRKKIKVAEISAVQRRRFNAILSGPELDQICPSSCDTDPAP